MSGRQFAGMVGSVVALLLASCGSSSTAIPASPSAKPVNTTPTPKPQDAVVIQAYLAQQKAFYDAQATADATSPALAATTVDPALHQLRLSLVNNSLNGIVGRGTHQYHPRVESLTPTAAVVVDCLYSEGVLVYQKTGQPVPPVTKPEWNLLRATMLQVSPGVWKLSDSNGKLGGCLPGS